MRAPNQSLVALAAALLALAPASAHAEHARCTSEAFGNPTIVPATGSLNVPRDTLLWLGDGRQFFGEMALVELVGGVEQRVPLTERGRIFDDRGNVWVLGSPVVLRPNTVHRLYSCYVESWCQTTLTEFTTGPDLESPTAVAPMVTDSVSGSVKDDAFVEVTLDAGGVVLVDDPDGDFDAPTLRGRVGMVADAPDGEFAMVESCDAWPLPKSGGEVRFGVYSLNGTFLGWSEPATFAVPYYSCSLGEPGPAGLLALPLLLLGRRRRRAR